MNCEILEPLYVRSNGDIPCNCDTGEQVLLGRIAPEEPSWDIDKVLANSSYTHIRATLSAGVAPWGDICTQCAFFRRDEAYSDNLTLRRIRKIQIEPSLACNLACPCCSNMTQIHSRPKPHLMKLEVLETLFQSLSQNSFSSVGEILYAGQGDPLMHPNFSEFVRLVRKYQPIAHQYLCTNGNFDYRKTTQGEFIDTIFVSCDGAFQQSYEQYRIGGDVNKAIQFMKDVPKTGDGRKQRLIWKYILFEFNDTDEELIAAQHLANSIGVDTLQFVFTHSRFKSVKYRPENFADVPIKYPNVITSVTPQFLNKDLNLQNKIEQQKESSGSKEHLISIRSLIGQLSKKFYRR